MRVPRWRIAAAAAVLLALLGFGAVFAPIYLDNLRLQNFVSGMTQDASASHRPDGELRAAVLARAGELDLPVKADNVHIERRGDTVRVEVRYIVRVNLPAYTVDLHFYPGAGSR